MSLKVAVVGAAGRMGLETVRALAADSRFEIVAAIGPRQAGTSLRALIAEAPDLTLEGDLNRALERSLPEVIIDYAPAETALARCQAAIDRSIPFVFGTTGITVEDLADMGQACESSGVPGMVVPNFALGAVLMMRFAELAARWLPDAEIIEFHHERKADAPSGTAILTARLIAEARTSEPTPRPAEIIKAEGARGASVDGIPVHSVRLPGLLAHQTVLFGQHGETLTIRHDSLDRGAFMPGVKLCLSRVASLSGLTIGMDALLQ